MFQRVAFRKGHDMNTVLPTSHNFQQPMGQMLNLIDEIFGQAVDPVNTAAYPPHNIIQEDENSFLIEIALAGFTEDQIQVTVEGSRLRIESQAAKTEADKDRTYLHRGIAQRAFRLDFRLGAHIEVQDAALRDGLLRLKLVRNIPEAEKPRQIPIMRTA